MNWTVLKSTTSSSDEKWHAQATTPCRAHHLQNIFHIQVWKMRCKQCDQRGNIYATLAMFQQTLAIFFSIWQNIEHAFGLFFMLFGGGQISLLANGRQILNEKCIQQVIWSHCEFEPRSRINIRTSVPALISFLTAESWEQFFLNKVRWEKRVRLQRVCLHGQFALKHF